MTSEAGYIDRNHIRLTRFANVTQHQPAETFRDYLTLKEAADFLGVSPTTLRNWDHSGKVKAIRHPVNHYRLMRKRA